MNPTGGGSYLRRPDGTLELIEAPTRPHPEGDAPRMADGTLIGADGLPVVSTAPETDAAGLAPDPAPADSEEEH